MNSPHLVSIQVSLPKQFGSDDAVDPMDRAWTTGFFKEAVTGPLQLRRTNLDGDGQADRVNHGGPDKAVLAYSARHYPHWRKSLPELELPFGAFGENFTIEELDESNVCIGDTWQIGEHVVVQVSQPRQPCWKLARRWRIKDLALQVQQNGRTGWYFRVVKEGPVEAGMNCTLLNCPHPSWTVERANQIMHHEKSNIESALELAALSELSESWHATLTRRAAKLESDPAKRLYGDQG